jgi:uncharacterized protein YjbI with pentapeptide repeats
MSKTNPWAGARPYTTREAKWFLGRAEDIASLRDRLEAQRLSFLTAFSAVGKTSLLQAGLLPDILSQRYRELARAFKDGLEAKPTTLGFPIVVNQWLGRIGSGRRRDYSSIVLVDAYEFLKTEGTAWFESMKEDLDPSAPSHWADALDYEFGRLKAAIRGLEQLASRCGVALVNGADEDTQAPLEVRPGQGEGGRSPETPDLLLATVDVLADTLGGLVLILDQFEEVLLDPDAGYEAAQGVELLYLTRAAGVRQLISLREDYLHLLRPLEDKELLQVRRRYTLSPLGADAARSIVTEVSRRNDVEWILDKDGEPLSSLVDRFTVRSLGASPGGDANLLGLNVVLRGLWDTHVDPERATLPVGEQKVKITEREVRAYEDSLKGPDGRDSDETLESIALKDWVTKSLAQRSETSDKYEESEIRPMVARMAEGLVSRHGQKRKVTYEDLEELAFPDLEEEEHLSEEIDEDRPEYELLEAVLTATCQEALRRLVAGNILKTRNSGSGQEYELVHDGFGHPMKDWALEFESTPMMELGALYPTRNKQFRWKKDVVFADYLNEELIDGRKRPVIRRVRWIDCLVSDVDFSEVMFEDCVFRRTQFVRCRFNSSTFLDCFMAFAAFEECKFVGVSFETHERPPRADGKEVEYDEVPGLVRAEFTKSCVLDSCHFRGTPSSPIPALTLTVKDCSFKGENSFVNCLLNGAAFRGSAVDAAETPGPIKVAGSLEFAGSRLPGAEFSDIDATGACFKMRDCFARGSLFSRVTLAPLGGETAPAGHFERVDLQGAVIQDCSFTSVLMSGREKPDEAAKTVQQRTSAATLVFRGTDRSAPAVLDDVTVSGIDLEGFSFDGCDLRGDLTFVDCVLISGTIEGFPAVKDPKTGKVELEAKKLEAEGRLTIQSCDMSGFCIADANLLLGMAIEESKFLGGIVRDVDLELAGDDHALKIDSTDISGTIFENVLIEGGLLIGAGEGGQTTLEDAGSPLFIGCTVKEQDLVLRGYDCDGIVMLRTKLYGASVKFEECSVLRAKIDGIERLKGDGVVDLSTSDFFLAEIGADLLKEEDGVASKRRLSLTAEQLARARELMAAKANDVSLIQQKNKKQRTD